MAKRHKKTRKKVVSIEAYRPPAAADIPMDPALIGRWWADFSWKDWSTLLAQLQAEVSQIDRAILALTKVAVGRGQLLLNQTSTPEKKQGRM
jgi:hypothetical protein